ncbi:MAG: hypothetical protein EOP09_01200 [Proteobacteria bacterium]|nr:MAG: hypothetical protein EOP09_01200 [Pseudomonadota bacterium]
MKKQTAGNSPQTEKTAQKTIQNKDPDKVIEKVDGRDSRYKDSTFGYEQAGGGYGSFNDSLAPKKKGSEDAK